MKVYEKKSFPRKASDLKAMYEKGNLSFDNAVQRSFVWKNTERDNRMSLLIDSIIRDMPIPAMYCNCLFTDPKSKKYDFLDGKQRTLTLIKFLSDEFPLVGLEEFEFEDGEVIDLNGKIYSELPENIRDIVRTFNFTVYYYENMSQEDAEEMFRRLNNGKSLTAIELTWANAVSKDKIRKLAENSLFTEFTGDVEVANPTAKDIIIKSYITLNSENKSFETKNVRPIIRDEEITDAAADELNKCFSIAKDLHSMLVRDEKKASAKKLYTKTHLLAMMPVFKAVWDKNYTMEELENFFISFFETGTRELSVSSVYNDNKRESTNSAVQLRCKTLMDAFLESVKDVA